MDRSAQNKPAKQQTPGGLYPLAGMPVARIGYGAMQLRSWVDAPEKARAVLERAIELGVNHIDTAEFYGNRFANRVIAQVIKHVDGIVVATKVGANPNPQGPHPLTLAQRPEQIRATVEANLESLAVAHLPLVNLRRLDAGPGVIPEADQLVNIDDQLAELIALRTAGKIGAIGLSGVNLDVLKHALPAGIACVQNAYSLVSREFEDMLTFCLAHNIAWVPFFPLGGAALNWPKVTTEQAVIDIAKRLQITPSQVGLAWLLQHSPNTLLIPGTASIEHLEENMATTTVVLDDAAVQVLDDIYRPA
ncbi:aldo/keto reductase [Chitinophaga silvisoli]|uniref:Aldo/keto reductase n=1 Tax=Chitinophaga silvisoli TaxID=2291814 RepID=A0A3E1NV17_9BACT|nr:aldo/keto reductase [Chitinophaga silvisoli]RFM31608.1 aldo/keto reductase [Chitinophaga silvisoli]